MVLQYTVYTGSVLNVRIILCCRRGRFDRRRSCRDLSSSQIVAITERRRINTMTSLMTSMMTSAAVRRHCRRHQCGHVTKARQVYSGHRFYTNMLERDKICC